MILKPLLRKAIKPCFILMFSLPVCSASTYAQNETQLFQFDLGANFEEIYPYSQNKKFREEVLKWGKSLEPLLLDKTKSQIHRIDSNLNLYSCTIGKIPENINDPNEIIGRHFRKTELKFADCEGGQQWIYDLFEDKLMLLTSAIPKVKHFDFPFVAVKNTTSAFNGTYLIDQEKVKSSFEFNSKYSRDPRFQFQWPAILLALIDSVNTLEVKNGAFKLGETNCWYQAAPRQYAPESIIGYYSCDNPKFIKPRLFGGSSDGKRISLGLADNEAVELTFRRLD